MDNFTQRPTVPCQWCGTETPMTGTKMCDNCWELDKRVLRNPDVTLRMMAQGMGADGFRSLLKRQGHV